jgi:hypothetical protein
MQGFQSKLTAYEQNPSNGHNKILAQSTLGLLFNRIKHYIVSAKKNKQLA